MCNHNFVAIILFDQLEKSSKLSLKKKYAISLSFVSVFRDNYDKRVKQKSSKKQKAKKQKLSTNVGICWLNFCYLVILSK